MRSQCSLVDTVTDIQPNNETLVAGGESDAEKKTARSHHHNINFSDEDTRVVFLIGMRGAGKTTLGRELVDYVQRTWSALPVPSGAPQGYKHYDFLDLDERIAAR